VYALNLNHSPENLIILGAGRSSQEGRRPYKRRVKDERRLAPPGSQTASSYTTVCQ